MQFLQPLILVLICTICTATPQRRRVRPTVHDSSSDVQARVLNDPELFLEMLNQLGKIRAEGPRYIRWNPLF